MTETRQHHIFLGMDKLFLQSSDLQRTSRYSYNLGYHFYLPQYLFATTYLAYAPDMRKKSKLVNVKNDLTSMHLGLGVFFTALFRFNLSIGPQWIEETIETSYDGSSVLTRDQETGFLYNVRVDYSIVEWLEMSLNLAQQKRPSANKEDLLYGLALSFCL